MMFDRPVVSPVLVGRAEYVDALARISEQARQGRGHVVLVAGEAGVGKSRLVAAAKAQALAEGWLALEGQCFEPDRTIPFAPLAELLRDRLAGLAPAELGRELGPAAPAIAGRLPDLPSVPSLEPQQQQRLFFEALAHYFQHLAAQGPLLLILEDLHWCDENSLAALLYLSRRIAAQRLLLCLTIRSEDVTPALTHFLAELERRHVATELDLPRLTAEQVGEMVRAIFEGHQPVGQDFLQAIYDLTDGNPFFIEEILKSMIASGEIAYAGGSWGSSPAGMLRIPRSVRSAVLRHAEKLSPAGRELLSIAAVVGQRFDFAVLQRVKGWAEGDLLNALKELIAAQLVHEVSAGHKAADRFAFRHALTRQVVYGELLARERRSLHGAIAVAFESLYPSPSTDDAQVADLAYHFYAADDWVKAGAYAQRAGERALALYAPGAAIEHLTHALAAAKHLQVQQTSQVYHARGQAYETRGEFERARSDYEHALAAARLAADGTLEWQSMMALGFLWAARDYAQAGTWFRRASEQALTLPDPVLRARSLNRLGNWLVNTGSVEEGLQAHQAALAIFAAQNDTRGIAQTHDLLGITYGVRGDRVRATDELGQAIALFRTLGDSQSLCSSLAMRAVQSMPGSSETAYAPLRTRDACVQDAAESLQLARQIDSRVAEAFAENSLAHTLLSFGEFGPALLHAQEAHRIATEIEHQQWIVATTYGLGRTCLLLLAPVPAIEHLAAGLSLARGLGSTFWIATLTANLALAYLLNHDLAAAEATLQAFMPREQAPKNMVERDIALAWGQLMLARGEPDEALHIADQLLDSAPDLAPEQPLQPIPHLLRLKGEALLALGKPHAAADVLGRAKQGAQERNARYLLWTIQRALGQTHQLLHHADQAHQELAAARRLIAELALTIDDAALRTQFESRASDSLPKEKPLPARAAAKRAYGGLTAREREVAALVAQGKTNREIAEQLVVSERTAEVHVGNILAKLGFAARTQIAVWAVEHGLA